MSLLGLVVLVTPKIDSEKRATQGPLFQAESHLHYPAALAQVKTEVLFAAGLASFKPISASKHFGRVPESNGGRTGSTGIWQSESSSRWLEKPSTSYCLPWSRLLHLHRICIACFLVLGTACMCGDPRQLSSPTSETGLSMACPLAESAAKSSAPSRGKKSA